MMLFLFLSISNWLNAEEGHGLAGYGSLLGFIAAVLMLALALLGGFFLAYLGTAGTAAAALSGGGAG